MDDSRDERDRRLMEYQILLEEERRKILMFQRELPLSLQLVTHAIERIRQQMIGGVSERPVLGEFIPLKPSCSSSMECDEKGENKRSLEEEEKPDWMRTVQLWNQNSEPVADEGLPKKPIAVDARRIGGAFRPFDRDMHAVGTAPPSVPPPLEKSTTAETNSKGSVSCEVERKGKEGNSQNRRKTRRCWSPELHRLFLQALQQLGGSHAATPKQIRELMKVDGLTNDEVKSHLQKYRLHTRRPAVQSSGGSSPQTQFLLVGGILVQPPECPAPGSRPSSASAMIVPRSIYTPIGSRPLESNPMKKNKSLHQMSPAGPLNFSKEGSRVDDEDDGAANPDSPSSSSLRTTTTSLT